MLFLAAFLVAVTVSGEADLTILSRPSAAQLHVIMTRCDRHRRDAAPLSSLLRVSREYGDYQTGHRH